MTFLCLIFLELEGCRTAFVGLDLSADFFGYFFGLVLIGFMSF
jgi:hypothetical protein